MAEEREPSDKSARPAPSIASPSVSVRVPCSDMVTHPETELYSDPGMIQHYIEPLYSNVMHWKPCIVFLRMMYLNVVHSHSETHNCRQSHKNSTGHFPGKIPRMKAGRRFKYRDKLSPGILNMFQTHQNPGPNSNAKTERQL